MHKNASVSIPEDGSNNFLQNVCDAVTYKSSLQVPAPAVVHEADKTGSQEVPHQDGDVCYQHVRHCQPHEFLQGAQGKGVVRAGTCPLLPTDCSHTNPPPPTLILLCEPPVLGGTEWWWWCRARTQDLENIYIGLTSIITSVLLCQSLNILKLILTLQG